MREVEAEIKKWGNSIGIILPKKIAEKEQLKEGQKIRVFFSKKASPVSQTFGIAKFSRSTEEILKEVDQEAWHE